MKSFFNFKAIILKAKGVGLIWWGNHHDLTSGSRCRVMFLEAGARSSNAGWRAEELPRAEVIYVDIKIPHKPTC